MKPKSWHTFFYDSTLSFLCVTRLTFSLVKDDYIHPMLTDCSLTLAVYVLLASLIAQ